MPSATGLVCGGAVGGDGCGCTTLEGCALHCGNGREATLAAVKPIAGPCSHVLDPRTVAEALSRLDGPEWEKVLLAEVGSCLELGVWEGCELPPGKQALPSQFIMERKRGGQDKVRPVAEGHRQQCGLDLEETFAPVCFYRTTRTIMAVGACEGLDAGV
jgi:hypothetical protein